jgi:hypothetical protein
MPHYLYHRGNHSGHSRPMLGIMRSIISALASSAHGPHDTSPTVSGDQAHSSAAPHRPARHGWATWNASQHAHNFEESARLLISGGMIPRGQSCSATRHVGRKSTKELLSLVPHSLVLFCRPVSMLIGQSATTQTDRPNCILAFKVYSGYG